MALTLDGRSVYQGGQNVETLRSIIEHHQHACIQVGGKSTQVDVQTANALLTVHDALNAESRVKFAYMLAQSPGTFRRLLDFCWKQVR